MGVPVFFKWMTMRNPKILRDAVESPPDSFDSANPYIDNFYVDMNGLIHPACNPKGQNIKIPSNFEEQCQNIYDYIDKIMNIVRPRKLVYLAIDGVAPRAKMNQQRSRRFRAAMEGEESKVKKLQLLEEYRKKVPDTAELEDLREFVNKPSFDSNLITPGTPFLDAVAQAIRKYVKNRLASHRLWKNLTVVFSDASCPGQGEHKIMDYIRQQRASSGYDPNQRHCIYGADADLIMLGLATHQPRFYIIREVVMTANQKWCSSCGRRGHLFVDCVAADSIQGQAKIEQKRNAEAIGVTFQFINLKLVREYLHMMFQRVKVPFGYYLERIIDDFVFLCFFVGNDFLPHVPCLTIREGGIDILMKVYDYCLTGVIPGYLTQAGTVNFDALKIFIREMSVYEDQIVQEIIIKQKQANSREASRPKPQKIQNEDVFIDYSDIVGSFKQEIRRSSNQQTNLQNYSVFGHELYSYKEKYYRQKFRIKPFEFLQLKHQISVSYMQALSWICHYYYKGVASWSWYYPFHYAPFFSDLEVFEPGQFELGLPFRPYEQLVAVLPQKTSHVLPIHLRRLMTENSSPIVDYFPTAFEIDLLGKKFTWLGEVLLPFIDDKRLLRAMGSYEDMLTAQEKRLNKLGYMQLYVNNQGTLGRKLAIYSQKRQIDALFEDFTVQGKLTLQRSNNAISEWKISIPMDRSHNCKLKEGIEYSVLQELNDDFMRRTDRKAYGGERFVRVIERCIGSRLGELGHLDRRRSSREERRDRERSRSREREREHRHRSDRDDKDRRDRRDERRGDRRQDERRDERRRQDHRPDRHHHHHHQDRHHHHNRHQERHPKSSRDHNSHDT